MKISSRTKKISLSVLAVFVLAGSLLYYEYRTKNIGFFKNLLGLMPIAQERKDEIRTAADIVSALSLKDGQTRTYLILFQNNMELRPSGGYIGSFGILKIKDGEVATIETHNTNNFDGRVPDGTPVPFPMQEMLGIKDWKMRDSNWFPDFKDSALKAEYFYRAGQGRENFDGIIGVNAEVLNSILEKTGPIKLPQYEMDFNKENAVMQLEYLVEKGYKEVGLKHADRKAIITDLAKAIIGKVQSMGYSEKLDLLGMAEREMNSKGIQLYFKDSALQEKVEAIGWGGRINTDWKGDYLMVNDANLAALKSDRVVKRSIDYTVDFSKDKPEAVLKISYTHEGVQKDWMTKDYQGYLRVYVPKGSWLTDAKNVGQQRFGEEYGRKFFGFIVKAPMGKTTTIELHYALPESIRSNPYDLLIQKQSGSGTVPAALHIIGSDGNRKDYRSELVGDYQLEK